MKLKIFIIIVFMIAYSSQIFAQGKWQIYTKDDGLSSSSVKELFEDSSGNIWALTTVWGVMKYDGKKWTNYKKGDGLVANEIQSIFEDSKGDIWLGTYSDTRRNVNGVMKYNSSGFDVVSKNPTQFIEEDSEGNIWSWSNIGPIIKYDGISVFKPTKKSGELLSNEISYCFENSKGEIWVGTGKGISVFDGNNWEKVLFTEKFDKLVRYPLAIIEDGNSVMWIGTNNGIYSFDGNSWIEYYKSNQQFKYYHFEKLYVDRENRLWAIIQIRAGWQLTARRSGFALWYFDNNLGEWRDYLNVDGAPTKKVSEIFEAGSGDLWFNTNAGIHKFDGSKWSAFNKDTGFRSNHYTAIGEDSKGNIWLGLGDEGLKGDGIAVFNGSSWQYYDSSIHLPSDRVFSIIEDSSGNIWLGTFKGIVKIYQ